MCDSISPYEQPAVTQITEGCEMNARIPDPENWARDSCGSDRLGVRWTDWNSTGVPIFMSTRRVYDRDGKPFFDSANQIINGFSRRSEWNALSLPKT
jgi:hypothetical protein